MAQSLYSYKTLTGTDRFSVVSESNACTGTKTSPTSESFLFSLDTSSEVSDGTQDWASVQGAQK